ncbi:hypothetical protein BJ322DRAFT_1104505 [Thelephora terrestris]|uniref:Uncharacterized protein n=1 Tax=Thelephora terrestris TaxID=56493 RepID=A0A9P6HQU3_9AGAM|nr:hypothetical protein BJ322DRAFT_1104505 [Thelephora terrestris]
MIAKLFFFLALSACVMAVPILPSPVPAPGSGSQPVEPSPEPTGRGPRFVISPLYSTGHDNDSLALEQRAFLRNVSRIVGEII